MSVLVEPVVEVRLTDGENRAGASTGETVNSQAVVMDPSEDCASRNAAGLGDLRER